MLSITLVALLLAPAQAKAPAKPAAAAAAPANELKSKSVDELMATAKELRGQLEFDLVLPIVEEIVSREGLPIEQTLDAYVLQGSCLAILDRPIDAEAPFRRLLRGRPEFDMPADTPPRILAVFRKVQAEERAIVEQMEALTRGRVIKGMELIGEHPSELKGGRPIVFDYLLKDPAVAAQSLRVHYRKKGEPSYSSLALARDATGRWRGNIPGEWTANDAGMQVELYLETLDAKGPLLTVGSATAPMARDIAPGKVDLSAPPPLPPWSVWLGAGTTAALLAAGAGFGAGMLVVQEDYDAQVTEALTVAQSGAELTAKANLGTSLSYAANGLFIASGVAALATVVAGAFFTDWEGRGVSEDASGAGPGAPSAAPGATPPPAPGDGVPGGATASASAPPTTTAAAP